MPQQTSQLDTILKTVALRYLGIIIIVFLTFSIYYWSEDLFFFSFITGISVIGHCFFFFIPYILDYKSIRLLIPIYLVFISLLLFPIVILFWRVGQVTVFMWYLLIPFAVMLFFSVKALIYSSISILLIICSIFFVSPFIPDEYIIPITTQELYIINIMTVIFCMCLIFYFLFYINKVTQIKMMELHDQETNDLLVTNEKPEDDIEKYNELYNNILDYFEKKKPYCDPDFNISQLAMAINSNVNYISKAIHFNENINFKVFVNTYRINLVKDMLKKDYQNKYTIRHIYTSSGFRHQSTFNKVFKQIEGITPSEYIKKMELD